MMQILFGKNTLKIGEYKIFSLHKRFKSMRKTHLLRIDMSIFLSF